MYLQTMVFYLFVCFGRENKFLKISTGEAYNWEILALIPVTQWAARLCHINEPVLRRIANVNRSL